MPATLPAAGLSFRRLGLFFGVLTSFLALQLVIAPEFGVSLTALSFIVCGMIIFMLAWPDLERDIVQFALIGAVLGGLGEGLASGHSYFSAIGGVLGAIVGALIGDEIQLSRKWYRLARQTRDGNRWWQKPAATSKWLTLVVGLACLLSIVGFLLLFLGGEYLPLPRSELSQVTGDVFAQLQAQQLEASTWKDIVRAWYVVIPLAMSMALSRLASRVADQPLVIEGLLRRIGILQCAALLLLAGDLTLGWVMVLAYSHHIKGIPGYYGMFVEHFAQVLRLTMFPFMLLSVAQLFLGKRMLRYWMHSGWLPALGIFALATVLILSFLLAYLYGVA